MKSAVIVYSLTGTTLALASVIAERLGADLVSLLAPTVRPGPGAMLLLGFRTLFLRRTKVRLLHPLAPDLDLAVLAAPVWAGRVAFPMRAWLESAPPLPARRALIMTGGAPTRSAGAMADFVGLVGGTVLATLYADEARVTSGRPLPQTEAFLQTLGG